MLRNILIAKIHRAWVTEANLNYRGSLTLGYALCQASGILPNEYVHITNINDGTHWVTYVIRDDERPTTVCLNGTAARHFQPGDPVIIMAYGLMEAEEAARHQAVTVHVDRHNQVVEVTRSPEMPRTPDLPEPAAE